MRHKNIVNNGSNNLIDISPQTSLNNVRIIINGDNNFLKVGADCNLRDVTIKLAGSLNRCEIAPYVVLKGNITVASKGNVYIGKKSTFGSIDILSEKSKIHIGDDCMFSYGIEVRSSDTHPVYSIIDHKRINTPKDIYIGDYVWCGKKVNIMKGAHIGHGCVIGLGSIVTGKEFPNFCSLGGTPAKILKENTIWTRHTRNEILKEDAVATYYIEKYNKAHIQA